MNMSYDQVRALPRDVHAILVDELNRTAAGGDE